MDIKIIGPAYHERYLDAEGKEQERGFYSFTVDGVPSLKWYPECNVRGLPKTYYIDRFLSRLIAGRSREAFGPDPTIAVGGISILEDSKGRGRIIPVESTQPATLEVGHGGRAKPKEAKPKFKFVLDGVESSEEFDSENAARTACAVRAFMTRGKLGLIPAAQLQLEAENPHKKCRVWACPTDHEIKAEVDGERMLIVWATDSQGKFYVQRFKRAVDIDTESYNEE